MNKSPFGLGFLITQLSVFITQFSVNWVLKQKKKKKLYRLTGVRSMNSVKKLSDENKSDVTK